VAANDDDDIMVVVVVDVEDEEEEEDVDEAGLCVGLGDEVRRQRLAKSEGGLIVTTC
jgi:hypothetical protein